MAAQIRELAETDVFAASLLAQRGKVFSHLETILNLYYQSLEDFRKIQSGQKTELQKLAETFSELKSEIGEQERKAIEHYLKLHASQIAQIMMDAITARDSNMLFELAEAVEFLKTFKPDGDPVRARILMERDIATNIGREWTASQLAKLIGWPKDDQENGFPHLRRLCKELKFPLKPASQIRKK